MGAADHSADPDTFDDAEPEEGEAGAVDRSHNRDTLSSEAMTEMLRDLQDSLLALDERVGSLEGAHRRGSAEARQLTLGVLQMGDEMNRRLRALEQVTAEPAPEPATPLFITPPAKPARPERDRTAAWTAGLAIVLALVLGVLWLLRIEAADQLQAAPKPAPKTVASPPAPPPAVANVATSKPAPTASQTHHGFGYGHYSTRSHQTSDSTPGAAPATDKTAATKPTAGFQLYGQGASSATPASPH